MGILGSMVKRRMELKSKTRELKTRLIIFWLLKDTKILLGSTHRLSQDLQNLLTHHHHPPPLESVIQQEEESCMIMMMARMMRKQGINIVQFMNNKNQTPMPAAAPDTKTAITATILDDDHYYKPTTTIDNNNREEGKNGGEDDVNVTVTDQPWTTVIDQDESTSDDDSYTDRELDDDNINIDEAAELFIRNFRRQLRLQKNQNSSSSSAY